MSVLTTFIISADFDMAAELEKTKGFKKTGVEFDVPVYAFGKDGKGYETGRESRYYADLDLSILWPEDWAKYTEWMVEKGVLNVDVGILDRLDAYCMNEYQKYLMDRPKLPEDQVFNGYGQQDGKYGYYIRIKGQENNGNQFVEYDEETLAEIKAGASELAKMWRLDEENGHVRRDLTGRELKKLATYTVCFSADGREATYTRNYAHGIDEIVPCYISKALGQKPVHVHITTENECDYNGDLVNGEAGRNQMSLS